MTSFFRRPGSAAILLSASLLWLAVVCPVAATADAQTAAPAPTPAPSEAANFDAVTARLDRGGSFYLYLDAAQWLGKLSEQIAMWRDFAAGQDTEKTPQDREKIKQAFDLAAALIGKSGLEQITGFGASSIALEPGVYRNTLFVHHDKGRETGFLGTFFGSAPHALTGLDLLPADTALASFGDCDLAGLLTTVRQTLEQSGIPEVKAALADGLSRFSMITGMSADDFLQSLGASSGIILTLDPAKQIEVPAGQGPAQTIPFPRAGVFIEVKDDRIFQRINELLGMFPGIEKTNEPALRMLTMAFQPMPGFKVRATVARWDKFLVLASDDQLLLDVIAAQKSGQGFKASPSFAKMAAGLPAEGNSFSLVTQAFTETVRRFQSGLFANQPPTGQAAFMQKYFASQPAGSSYGILAHVEDGWLSVNKGPQSLNRAVVPLMLVPAGMAAGLMLPVISTSQQKGNATKSLAQEKQIALACKLYAADHSGNFPPSLQALLPKYLPDNHLFASPFAPHEPLGYTYHTGLTDASPAETVLLEDKFSPASDQRVVVHADVSGEITKLPGK
jgi:hypothetical protein